VKECLCLGWRAAISRGGVVRAPRVRAVVRLRRQVGDEVSGDSGIRRDSPGPHRPSRSRETGNRFAAPPRPLRRSGLRTTSTPLAGDAAKSASRGCRSGHPPVVARKRRTLRGRVCGARVGPRPPFRYRTKGARAGSFAGSPKWGRPNGGTRVMLVPASRSGPPEQPAACRSPSTPARTHKIRRDPAWTLSGSNTTAIPLKRVGPMTHP